MLKYIATNHKEYAVVLVALEEDISEQDYFKNQCGWNRQQLAHLKKQNNMFFCANLQLWKDGRELASKYLGACSYKSLEEFMQCEYYSQMLEEALDYVKNHLIFKVASQLNSYGYKVYVSQSKNYGFYTNGSRVIYFQKGFGSVNFSGQYSAARKHEGNITCSGWQILEGCISVTEDEAKRMIELDAPQWATKGCAVEYTTPVQYLSTSENSFYKEFKP